MENKVMHFGGAYYEADRLGYTEALVRSMFVTGYLSALRRPIVTNQDGIIL